MGRRLAQAVLLLIIVAARQASGSPNYEQDIRTLFSEAEAEIMRFRTGRDADPQGDGPKDRLRTALAGLQATENHRDWARLSDRERSAPPPPPLPLSPPCRPAETARQSAGCAERMLCDLRLCRASALRVPCGRHSLARRHALGTSCSASVLETASFAHTQPPTLADAHQSTKRAGRWCGTRSTSAAGPSGWRATPNATSSASLTPPPARSARAASSSHQRRRCAHGCAQDGGGGAGRSPWLSPPCCPA